MAIYLMIKCDLKEWADRRLNNHLNEGYKYIPAILEMYKYYEDNRTRYKTFEDFYPTLLGVFSEAHTGGVLFICYARQIPIGDNAAGW